MFWLLFRFSSDVFYTYQKDIVLKNAAKIDLLDICPCPVADPRDRAKNHHPCPGKNRWVPEAAA